MAKAKETQIEVVKTETGYTLELTLDEATMLADVLARVGGSPNASRRGLADNVTAALHEAGVFPVHKLGNYDSIVPEDLAGGLTFRENTPRLDPRKQR